MLRLLFLVTVALIQLLAGDIKSSTVEKGIASLQNYFSMAGTQQFRPQTQHERAVNFRKELFNVFTYVKVGASAGLDQWNGKQREWGQGAAGYGKRAANIAGQYAIQKSVMYGVSATLHEDNRYFGSGKTGVWTRTGYALKSSVLARNDAGRHHLSVSRIGGVAAGAFAARLWLPPSESDPKDGAISFGISMGAHAATCVLKEFLPDIFRRITGKTSVSALQSRTVHLDDVSLPRFSK